MNGQFETQNPVENTVTPANQMETPTPEAPKKKGNKIAIIAGVVAAVVVVGGVGVFAAVKTGVFLSPSKKVLLAGAKTVSDMGSLGETLKDCVSLYSDEYTLKMDLSMNEGDISMEGRSSKEQKQIKGNLNISGAPSIDFLASTLSGKNKTLPCRSILTRTKKSFPFLPIAPFPVSISSTGKTS